MAGEAALAEEAGGSAAVGASVEEPVPAVGAEASAAEEGEDSAAARAAVQEALEVPGQASCRVEQGEPVRAILVDPPVVGRSDREVPISAGDRDPAILEAETLQAIDRGE